MITANAIANGLSLDPGHDDDHMGDSWGGMMGWMGWMGSNALYGWAVLLLIVVAVVAIVVVAARSGQGPTSNAPATPTGPPPQDILDTRLANGDISLEEHKKLSARIASGKRNGPKAR